MSLRLRLTLGLVLVNAVVLVTVAYWTGQRDRELLQRQAQRNSALQTEVATLVQARFLPEDVGNLVAWLASPLSRSVNGSNLRIDGGSAELRIHAIAAIQRSGMREASGPLLKTFKKESKDRVRIALVRALAVCDPSNPEVKKAALGMIKGTAQAERAGALVASRAAAGRTTARAAWTRTPRVRPPGRGGRGGRRAHWRGS